MKRFIGVALIAIVLAVAIPAHAAKVWDDMSWWGNTGATPEPVADSNLAVCSRGRSGYWWWPTVPASNVDDSELWGNRGIVYHRWAKLVEDVPPPPPPPPPPPGDEDKDGVTDDKDRCPGTPAGTRVDEIGCFLELNLMINFAFNSSEIPADSKDQIDQGAQFIKSRPADVQAQVIYEVGGHTDSIGSDAFNQRLSERRANAVRDRMIADGIPADQITAVGYGETQPIASNETDEGRAQNRRVTIRALRR